MKVKTRIVFEVVYPLDLEFYGTNDKGNPVNEEEALDIEREYVKGNSELMVSLFEDEGTFTTSVEKIEEEKLPAETNKTWVDGTYVIHSTGTTEA